MYEARFCNICYIDAIKISMTSTRKPKQFTHELVVTPVKSWVLFGCGIILLVKHQFKVRGNNNVTPY